MTIILNDGSLVNYDHIAMIGKSVSCENFGQCQCDIIKLTLYSDGFPKCIIAEEAERNVINNVLNQITDAVTSGKTIIDLSTMGLTDGDKLSELKREIERAYKELEDCLPSNYKPINSIVESIQEKKEAIAKVFHMSTGSAEKFVKSDKKFIPYKVEQIELERKRMQPVYADKCEDEVLIEELEKRGYKVRRGGKLNGKHNRCDCQ